jgi:hypothetical protein
MRLEIVLEIGALGLSEEFLQLLRNFSFVHNSNLNLYEVILFSIFLNLLSISTRSLEFTTHVTKKFDE